MKPIARILTMLGIATLIGGLPLVVRAQPVPPNPSINNNLETQSDLEINQFNQGNFGREIEDENQPLPVYSTYDTAYGAPAYRIQNLPTGVGGEDLGNLPEIYLVDLGYRQQAQPVYRQGDNLIQIQLTNF